MLNTTSKKVTGEFLCPGRNVQPGLTLLAAGFILTKCQRHQRHLTKRVVVSTQMTRPKEPESTTNNEPCKIVFKMTQIKRQGKVHS